MQTNHTFTPRELRDIAELAAPLFQDLDAMDPLTKPQVVNHWLPRLSSCFGTAELAEKALIEAEKEIVFITASILPAVNSGKNNLLRRLSAQGKASVKALTQDLGQD